ncbi:MAG: signal recognition particle-docking protein FtsY [Pseudomonadota bacterium]
MHSASSLNSNSEYRALFERFFAANYQADVVHSVVDGASVVETLNRFFDTSPPAIKRSVQPIVERPKAVEKTTPAVVELIPEKNRFARLKKGLAKTRAQFGQWFDTQQEMDAAAWDRLETQLLMSDVGIKTTERLLTQLHADYKKFPTLQAALKHQLLEILNNVEPNLITQPTAARMILIIGVNGVGKTTSVGKLASYFKSEGQSVVLAAGDTFRAAAVEQLKIWGERTSIPVIAQDMGSDSASVIFDALNTTQARKANVLLADTAGRLHNKSNLMNELKKIVRVVKKLDPQAPHEVWLVVDGGTGQNALLQAREFNDAIGLTGLIVTKLDGTAKGGVVFSLLHELKVPIRFIGVGEGVDDLRPFDAEAFIDAICGNE